MTLPDYLEFGQRARLLPVVSESNKENRLIGPVLGAMPLIPELTTELLKPLGVRIGSRAKISCYTEVVFKKIKGLEGDLGRPDGLIVVETGRNTWRCLVEAKFGSAKLDCEQVERYLKIANATRKKDCRIDAVLTISNEFVATPRHSPVSVSSTLTKNCDLFHLSWSAVATSVDLLLANDDVGDKDRTLVLNELHEYLRHSASQISGFTQMNKEWKDVVKSLSSGAKIPKSDIGALGVVSSWHEEQKDMCLILSRLVKRTVSLRLPRAHIDSNELWQAATLEQLLSENRLHASLNVPDAANPIDVEAVLTRKSVKFSMRVKVDEGKKTTKARVNALMRQLKEAVDPRLELQLNFPGRKDYARVSLDSIRQDVDILDEYKSLACTSIDVILFDDQGAKFNGSKTFIEQTERSLDIFYEQVGACAKNWQPSAPKPVKELNEPEEVDTEA